jgi:tetratricopeptide (TPR) repeat protein
MGHGRSYSVTDPSIRTAPCAHVACTSSAAGVIAYFGEDIDAAIALTERALALNPSSARGWNWSAWLRLWVGQPDLAVEHFETSMRLSPVIVWGCRPGQVPQPAL